MKETRCLHVLKFLWAVAQVAGTRPVGTIGERQEERPHDVRIEQLAVEEERDRGRVDRLADDRLAGLFGSTAEATATARAAATAEAPAAAAPTVAAAA